MKQRDSLIFVYDGDSGVAAMMLDVLKKAVGREECALCEIVYSPVGKRRVWKACAARLGLAIAEMHRDRIPGDWNLKRDEVPCVLARVGSERPFVILKSDDIAACRGSADLLERRIRDAMAMRQTSEMSESEAVTT